MVKCVAKPYASLQRRTQEMIDAFTWQQVAIVWGVLFFFSSLASTYFGFLGRISTQRYLDNCGRQIRRKFSHGAKKK